MYSTKKVMSQKFSDRLLTICGFFWAIPCVLFIRILRPWRIIRLSFFDTLHIGHFVMDSGIQWAMAQQETKHKFLDIYYFNSSKISNDFWAKMVRRNFIVAPRFWLRPIDLWNRLLPGGAAHYLIPPVATTSYSSDMCGWLVKAQGSMPFLPEEDDVAKQWLRRQGWQDGELFICLLVRDSAYHGTQGGTQAFRNSDIATYVDAAEWLANQGVWVLRMGKTMANPMPSSHPRLIDYAFHSEKSDFLDIWLFAHCYFCITSGSGAQCISHVYNRPTLMLNYTPLTNLISWSNVIHLPKTLVWQKSGVPLTWREYVDTVPDVSKCQTTFFLEAGIKIIDLTPEEILSAVQEYWQRLNETWIDREVDCDRHQRFWEILQDSPNFSKMHRWVYPGPKVGTTWLRSMGDDFLN